MPKSCDTVNLYFQDESRFGLKTYMGSCIAAKGVQPLVPYQHRFDNTYLYGAYSPIDGSSYTWELPCVNKNTFVSYLESLAHYRPKEFKIVVIDNASFHSVKDVTLPDNLYLLRIPPHTPELNPCEQIWREIKKYFKRKVFSTLDQLKEWLYLQVRAMSEECIKSITSNHHYVENFTATFYG